MHRLGLLLTHAGNQVAYQTISLFLAVSVVHVFRFSDLPEARRE